MMSRKNKGSSSRDKRKRKNERLAVARAELAGQTQIKFRTLFDIAPHWDALISTPHMLTTPKEVDERIQQFCSEISDQPPYFIDCSPEPWSRLLMCNVNAQKYAEQHGGYMLCGYRIWDAGGNYLEAERHAIWTDGKARRDVSFSSDGEERILFVPDFVAKQNDYDASPLKIRFGLTEEARALIVNFERLERLPSRMSDEEGWNRMPTYEEFKQRAF